MKVISINNQKGGVGKTTTALALASILTKKSKKVLLVDCDGSSQTLTKILTRKEATNNTLTDLILLQTMGRDISPFAKQTIFNCDEGYDLLTADNKLVAASASLSMQHNLDIRFGTLKHICESNCKIMISGYDNKLYDDYLSAWNKLSKNTTAECSVRRTETIWMNYSVEHQIYFEREL